MSARRLIHFLLSSSLLATSSLAQEKPVPSPLGAAVEKEVKGLSAADFPAREAALARLQTLVAEQIKQRAQIQEIISTLQADLAQEQHALALVSDEEAQAQIAGLLEMERGLSGWTIQTMTEPLDKRQALLNWGLTKDTAPALARAYSQNKRIRVEGVKQLAKLPDDGVSWTLGRLINDQETAVRAVAMAVSWDRKPTEDIVNALWFRAVAGPQAIGDNAEPGRMGMAEHMPQGDMFKVDFPGGDPIDFSTDDEAGQFFDSQLAANVLVHLNSPLVGERVKALVAERIKAGKNLSLSDDPDWTLAAHWLVETYAVKEAIPLLAAEALGSESEEMGGEMNGRPFMWSRRTMAIGTLCKLLGKDAADFEIMRAHDTGNPRDWMWAVDVNPQMANMGNNQADGNAVRAFFAFWKEHHAEYGVKEEPSNAGLPTVRRGGMGGKQVRPIPVDGPVQILPVPGDAPATPYIAPEPPVRGRAAG